ncbi:unknown protein [Microcystis aeruginosa NIES-843]|uniref:Uncharacterized protein n=1 Tax=Microcystis aeruginosa (strain NIES-843 / IAM M-2473) TaxID=449447 RepID=B0JFX3_MICAN|nr:unknown protein [Microcystis aeruginosa NIES-843]
MKGRHLIIVITHKQGSTLVILNTVMLFMFTLGNGQKQLPSPSTLMLIIMQNPMKP